MSALDDPHQFLVALAWEIEDERVNLALQNVIEYLVHEDDLDNKTLLDMIADTLMGNGEPPPIDEDDVHNFKRELGLED